MWNPPLDMFTRLTWVVIVWSIIQLVSIAFVLGKIWPQKKALKAYSISLTVTTFTGIWWATYLPFRWVVLITIFFGMLLSIGLVGSKLFLSLRDMVIHILTKNFGGRGK